MSGNYRCPSEVVKSLNLFDIAKLQRKFGNAKGNVEKNNFECAKIAEIFGN